MVFRSTDKRAPFRGSFSFYESWKRPSLLASMSFSLLLLFASAGAAFAETTERARGDAFQWWSKCEHMALALPEISMFSWISCGLWIAFIALAISLLHHSWKLLSAQRDELHFHPIHSLWLALIAVTTLLVGRQDFVGITDHRILKLFFHPSMQESWLVQLRDGLVEPLSFTIQHHPVILRLTTLPFAALSIVIVYLLGTLVWRRSSVGLIAALLFCFSPAFLAKLSTNLPNQRLFFLAAIALLSIQLFQMQKRSYFLLLSVFSGFMLGIFSPPASIVLFVLLIVQPALWRAWKHLAIVEAFILFGTFIGLSLVQFDISTLPFPSFSILRTSAFVGLGLILGVYNAIQQRHFERLSFLIPAFSVLVLRDSLGGLSLVSTMAMAFLVTDGFFYVGRLAGIQKRLIIAALILEVLVPFLFAFSSQTPSLIYQSYHFHRALFQDLTNQGDVLYLPLNDPDEVPVFLVPPKSGLCLRPFQALSSDPQPKGAVWVYFSPRCQESEEIHPNPGDCRFVKSFYDFGESRYALLTHYGTDGRPAYQSTVSTAKVLGFMPPPVKTDEPLTSP